MFNKNNSRLSHRDFSGMRSSRSISSSRMSSSRSSGIEDYTGYSLITNDRCVNTPRAKLFIVAALSCVVAVVIVIIVIVTKLEVSSTSYTQNDSICQLTGCTIVPEICAQYAVIGSGLAGSYATWKLSQKNSTVVLYEATERIGGRLNSQRFPNVSGVNVELGLPYYIPKLHMKTAKLIHDLGLETKPYYGPNPLEITRYFTRGNWAANDGISSLSHSYNLDIDELALPRDLFRKRLQSAVPFEIPAVENSTGEYTNDQSVRTALLGQLSVEAYSYIKDIMHQLDFQDEANAAQFLEYLNKQDTLGVTEADLMTLKYGMSSLPQTLLFEASQRKSIRYQTNHTLTHLVKQADGNMGLTFSKSTGLEDGTVEITEEVSCARTVVLAIPPKALQQVQWEYLADVEEDLEAIAAIPSHVIYLLYNGHLLEEEMNGTDTMWIHTDLPLGEVGIFHAERNTGKIYVPPPETTTAFYDMNETTTVEQNNTNTTDNNITSSNQTTLATVNPNSNVSTTTAPIPIINPGNINNGSGNNDSSILNRNLRSVSNISDVEDNSNINDTLLEINSNNTDNNSHNNESYINNNCQNISSIDENSNNTATNNNYSSNFENINCNNTINNNDSNIDNINNTDNINMTTTGDVFNITTIPPSTESPDPVYIMNPVTIIRCVFSAQDYHNYWKSILNRGSKILNFTSYNFLTGQKSIAGLSPDAINGIELSDLALEHINVHLSKVLNVTSVEDMPHPVEGFVTEVDGDNMQSSMGYIWKPGYNWREVSRKIYQPNVEENVVIVGQAYAPSFYSLGVEGAIQTVDNMFPFSRK